MHAKQSFNLLNVFSIHCVVAENIHTPTTEGHWKFRGGGGSQRSKVLKESISLNWNFQKGGGFKPKLMSLFLRNVAQLQ